MHIAASSFKNSRCVTPAKAALAADIEAAIDDMELEERTANKSSMRQRRDTIQYSAQKRSDTQGDKQSLASLADLPPRREVSAYNMYDVELSNEEKSVCFHCTKIIEMFKKRHKAITFPNSQVKTTLDGLRLTQKSNWDNKDIEYLVLLYATCV